MTVLRVTFEPEATLFCLDASLAEPAGAGARDFAAPCGAASLTTDALHSDPPRPEELTNAIGMVLDHLDDLVREIPEVIGADVCIVGELPHTIASVELGHAPTLPMALARDAVEDVFRTLATEPASERRHNPGLAEAHVPTVVGGCCIAVALMRRLHLDQVTVVSP